MEKTYDINTKLCCKENKDLVYFISAKKHLNGILHYLLESDHGQIYLSEFAVKDRYLHIDVESKTNNIRPAISRLYSKITDTVSKA